MKCSSKLSSLLKKVVNLLKIPLSGMERGISK
jgi:hypothetical protein